MMFNIEKGDKNSKLGTPSYILYLVLLKDVNFPAWPAPKDATIKIEAGSSLLKPGKKFNSLESKNATINPNVEPGESPYEGHVTLSPVLEGITKRNLTFIYDNVGEDFIAVWKRCSDGQKFIAGSECSSGLKLSYTNIGQQEGGIHGIALQLLGGDCPEPFYFLDGDIEVEEDEATP